MTSDLSERLQRIEQKLNPLVKMLEERLSTDKDVSILPMKVDVPSKVPINVYLMKLPDSLRHTMFVMDKLREATTTQVAKETGRSRSVESIHLNQLERMGYLEKYRKGRTLPKALQHQGLVSSFRSLVTNCFMASAWSLTASRVMEAS